MTLKNLPNYLTYFRIVCIPALTVAFFVSPPWSYYLSLGIFWLASVTDWLDGYVARMLKADSQLGRFLDPIADKLLVATTLMLLVSDVRVDYSDGRAMMIPAIAIVCREILVSGLREFLACIHVPMPVSRLAKWKTTLQMLAIMMLLLGGGGPAWLHAGIVGNISLWIAALLTIFTGYTYLKLGISHMMEEDAKK